MPRLPRNVVPGHAVHVIQRGNNRQAIYFAESDYRYFRDTLQAAAEKYSCSIHAYVFMTNHVHLLVTPDTKTGLSQMMQSAGSRYVRYINRAYQRTGTLWDGRFKSAIIDSERYLLACSRYIELNPVRAGMIADPGDYRWSSYRHNAMGRPDDLLTPHALYLGLAGDNEQRSRCYASLFRGYFDKEGLAALRTGTENGGVVGNTCFRGEIEQALKRRVAKYAHGGDRKSKKFRKSSESSTLTP